MLPSFRPVNSQHLLSPDPTKEDTKTLKSPTTPRPTTAPHPLPTALPLSQPPQTMDDATTPTRATFGLGQQKPLPQGAFPESAKAKAEDAATDKKPSTRENSQQPKRSRDSMEMDADDSDKDGEDGAGSDGEGSVKSGDGTKSSKKKKNQKFWCTDYPPCHLSFTRSEHLARHIRKHTGERPFKCHCQRRFSRLDNLRQHAQTVHINEDIPIDSLAATGTRFQRQIRTDRVQRGGRVRASTIGNAGGPIRGHSKSLSTSSIGSISSVGSSYSTIRPDDFQDDFRRRPPPLVMADPNARLSVESYRSIGSAQFPYRPTSPSDYSTPTSATFSTGQSSPHWGSGVGSPATSYSRSHVIYHSSGARTPGRRLSVPSAGNPFQSPHGAANLGRPLFTPGSLNASHSAALASPGGSSYVGSPTTSTNGGWYRRDSLNSAAEEAWRRRTWHPDSNNFVNPPGSRLSQVVTSSQLEPPPEPLPAVNNHDRNPQQNVRLPGIESLLPKSSDGRPMSPLQRPPSPMMIDSERNPTVLLPSVNISAERLHRGLNRLEISNLTRPDTNNTTPPPHGHDGAGTWANEVQAAMQARVEQPRPYQPTVRFEPQPQIVHPPPNPLPSRLPRGHQHTMSAPLISTSRDNKRHGWYNGPVTVHEDRVLEARPHVDRIAHPNLHHFTGFPARGQPPSQQQPGSSDPYSGFKALVAAAASESSTATAC